MKRRMFVGALACMAALPVKAQTPRRIRIWINAFIPKDIPGLTKPAGGRYLGDTMIPGPVHGVSDCFLTDNRSFSSNPAASSRLHSLCDIDLAQKSVASQMHRCDPTVEVDCEDFTTECNRSASTSNMRFAPVSVSGTLMTIAYEGAASNGCFTGAPDIDIIGTITVDLVASTLSFDGNCEPFPAFEIYMSVDDGSAKTLVQRLPDSGTSPWNLPGSPNRAIRGKSRF